MGTFLLVTFVLLVIIAALVVAFLWALDNTRKNVWFASACAPSKVRLPADINIPTATRLKTQVLS